MTHQNLLDTMKAVEDVSSAFQVSFLKSIALLAGRMHRRVNS